MIPASTTGSSKAPGNLQRYEALSVMTGETSSDGGSEQLDDVESVGDSRSKFEGADDSNRGDVESGEAATVRQSDNADHTLCCRLDTAVMLVIGLVCIGAVAGGIVDQPAAGAACGAGLSLLFLCCLCAISVRGTPAARYGLPAAATPAGQALSLVTTGTDSVQPPQDSGYERC